MTIGLCACAGMASASDTAARKKIFVCRPASKADEPACAKNIVSTLIKHAYRRPATPEDLAAVMQFYTSGRSEGGKFDDGIEAALQRILADPQQQAVANRVVRYPYADPVDRPLADSSWGNAESATS